MSTENTRELREQLKRNERVIELIRIRAYEIYESRGGQPGQEAGDWYQAESEVLKSLVESEFGRPAPDEHPAIELAGEGPRTLDPIHSPEISERLEPGDEEDRKPDWSPAQTARQPGVVPERPISSEAGGRAETGKKKPKSSAESRTTPGRTKGVRLRKKPPDDSGANKPTRRSSKSGTKKSS